MRSRADYGRPFTAILLDDLIKDDLLPALQRCGNEGLRPVFLATAAHYRRGLQIIRLTARGVDGRDALIIHLFLRGYGVQPWEIREAVGREYARLVRSASAKVRSSYIDNERGIGEKHKASLGRQLGDLDGRLSKAGLGLPVDTYLQLTRAGRSPNRDPKNFLTGWLLIDPETGALSDVIREAISQPDGKFIEARDAFHRVDARFMRRVVPSRTINDPKFAIILFVVMLCCVTWRPHLERLPADADLPFVPSSQIRLTRFEELSTENPTNTTSPGS